jgi:hypothetical protein
MNHIPAYLVPIASGTTATSDFEVGKFDQLLVYVPALSTVAGSGTVRMSLRGSPSTNLSTVTAHYYDYVSGTPSECRVTITTKGVYEFPNPGAFPVVSFQFDVAATQATSFYILTPKGTY